MSKKILNAACKDIFENTISITKEEAAYLEDGLQSRSSLWHMLNVPHFIREYAMKILLVKVTSRGWGSA